MCPILRKDYAKLQDSSEEYYGGDERMRRRVGTVEAKRGSLERKKEGERQVEMADIGGSAGRYAMHNTGNYHHARYAIPIFAKDLNTS